MPPVVRQQAGGPDSSGVSCAARWWSSAGSPALLIVRHGDLPTRSRRVGPKQNFDLIEAAPG